jgi:hypothetical protein
VGELRVDVDELRGTAAWYAVSAGELAGGVAAGGEPSGQPSAGAVSTVRAGAEVVAAALSARAAATGAGVAAAGASYVDNEAESAAKLHAVGSQLL